MKKEIIGGMYVRVDQMIGRVVHTFTSPVFKIGDVDYCVVDFGKGNKVEYECKNPEIIGTATPNILDLLQPGDYLNGFCVNLVLKDYDEVAVDGYLHTIKPHEIKRVLTKEMVEMYSTEVVVG